MQQVAGKLGETSSEIGNEIPHILLVEDDEVDVMYFQRQIAKSAYDINVIATRDGQEALDFLKSNGQQIKPFLIVTDLNMPGVSGFEFIDAIRADKGLEDSIIFVFSSSKLESDIAKSYEKHVAGYICKQADNSSEQEGIQLIIDYCDRVQLPN